MRNHRARAAALSVRHTRFRSRIRSIERALRWPVVMHTPGIGRTRLDVYASATVIVAAGNNRNQRARTSARSAPVTTALARVYPAPATPPLARLAEQLGQEAFRRRMRSTVEPANPLRPAPRPSEPVAPARERIIERVHVIEREVARTGSTPPAAAVGATVAAVPAPYPPSWPARSGGQTLYGPGGPARSGGPAPIAGAVEPAQLATITDHVLVAIDRRLTAYGERLGRG